MSEEKRRHDDGGVIGFINRYWKLIAVVAAMTWAGLNASTEKRISLIESKMIDVLTLLRDQAAEERDYRKTVREEMSSIRVQILELAKAMKHQ